MIIKSRESCEVSLRRISKISSMSLKMSLDGVVVQWCNLTLQPEQSGGHGVISGMAPSFDRHDKESWTRLALRYFYDPSARR